MSAENLPPGLNLTYTGKVFSLDGIHPSNVGHGLLANLVLKKLEELRQAGEINGLKKISFIEEVDGVPVLP